MKKHGHKELGAVYGMFGSAIGFPAYIITDNALFLIFPMWGVVLGLVIGSLLDKEGGDENERNN